MTDTFVLVMIGEPYTILNKHYWVKWDRDLRRAYIEYTVDGMKGKWRMDKTFTSELKACQYLNELAYLAQPQGQVTDWRKL